MALQAVAPEAAAQVAQAEAVQAPAPHPERAAPPAPAALRFELPRPAGTLVAHRHAVPPGTPLQGQVVVAPAVGVRQSFYQPFAHWLAQQGWQATTFDYLGFGDSWPPGRPLRGLAVTLEDWAADYGAVVADTAARCPGQPLVLAGHSLGAQLPGLLPDLAPIRGLLSIAAGSGYWRDCAGATVWKSWLLWHGLHPLLTPALGYFPGRRIGGVGDLPAGVFAQWRRWCLHPRYSVGAEGAAMQARYQRVRFPMEAFSFADDEMMSLRSTEVLLSLYENAPSRIHRLAPADLGLPRIGHVGCLRPALAPSLWPLLAQALQRLKQHQPGVVAPG